ncbi:hypothetical protein RHDC4_00644 [Rhodocyclaceae bacterium]|nr:hypothetical protein RHDC4_00644 [Rhodocyclaceae bacterium]
MSAGSGIRRTLAALALTAAAASSLATGEIVTVYKSPSCGCCAAWADYMRQNGFTVNIRDVDDVGAARQRAGMPQRYGACHTATVGGYAVEGHVPAADVRRLLAERPKAVGIAVPSMPPGSPGMPSPKPVAFDTLLVRADGGHQVYARH